MDAALIGVSGLWFAAALAAARAVLGPPGLAGPDGPRRADLARADAYYRRLGRTIERLAARVPPALAERTEIDLRLAAVPARWTGAEFVARARAIGWLWGVACGSIGLVAVGPAGLAAGLLAAAWYPSARLRELAARARDRLETIRLRLPFAVDLVAAQLTAGLGPAEAIRRAAVVLGDHPVGVELAALARAVEGGRPLGEAARNSVVFQADADLAAIAAELARAQELGVALAPTFRGIARQLRLRATQWAERAAEEARGRMAAPVFLVSIACIIVMAAPVLLEALHSF
jgi:Flp pilus assembly protein TadB